MNTTRAALESPETLLAQTLPGLLLDRARRWPDRIACRAKRRGIYEELSWRELACRVAVLAQALETLGLKHGDRLAIMGDACEEWLLFDLACQSLGGITYGIYPTASASELAFQMTDGGAAIFVAEDQEYVDRILGVAESLERLRTIIVVDATALFMLDDPRIVRLDDLWPRASEGSEADALLHHSSYPDTRLDELAARARRVAPEDPAFIVYTSGTTGHPKGALIGHGRHLAGASNLMRHYPALSREHGRTVAYLPLCHVLGRDIAVTLPLLGGPVPHFGESVDDLAVTLFEVAPTVLFTVPRYLQKFASQVLTAVGNSTPVKRRVFDWALAVGRRHASARWAEAAADSTLYRIAREVAFRPVLNKLGLDRIELVLSGGAPLPVETATFWQMLGLDVCEIYGQTETAGAIITGQRGPFPRPGDVGTVAEGIEVRLVSVGAPSSVHEGEVHIRSRYLFEGYWNAEPARDDWLASGDVGRLDGDRLRLIDRARDFIVTAGGKTLSPSHIESALRGSRYIAEIVVFGQARKYIAALVEIDEDAVADWARAHGVVHAGFTSLTIHPEVRGLIQGEIDRANETLSRVERIKRFTILPKAMDPEEEGEPVTPTRKVKRKQMYERYADRVEAMYGRDEESLLEKATSG